MANREELLLIRAARAGQASAQLNLGKRYLFGGAGLPKSLPTALYWLDRAALQDEQDAWLLIGSHVPFETARQALQPDKLCIWYERAYDAGVLEAGLVLAKLVLGQVSGAVSESMRGKALRALQAAAQAGIAEAQWLLAQHLRHNDARMPDRADGMGFAAEASLHIDSEAMLEWATRAAQSGVLEAQVALADHAWATTDYPGFLRWALPVARRLADRFEDQDPAARQLRDMEIRLLTRCGQALFMSPGFDASEVERFWECAARAGNRDAQFLLGLWLARMNAEGKRVSGIPGPANYKKSLRWLTAAGEQGLADAWYALSRIYLKPECSQRNLADAKRHLEKAAQCGHGAAQFELGMTAWRTRREDEARDIQAVYWLQKAAAQDVAEAGTALDKIAARPAAAAWAAATLPRIARDAARMYPLMVARIELAAAFGLSRTEALLIDPKAADCGHCLLVDIRAHHPHSKRRLIRLQTADERRTLERIVRLFERMDCSPDGPEGNYRQRLYRLKSLIPNG